MVPCILFLGLLLTGQNLLTANTEEETVEPTFRRGSLEVFQWDKSETVEEEDLLSLLGKRTGLQIPEGRSRSILWISQSGRDGYGYQIRWTTDRAGMDEFLSLNHLGDSVQFDEYNFAYHFLVDCNQPIQQGEFGWYPREIVDYKYCSKNWVEVFWSEVAEDCVIAYIVQGF